MTEGQESEERVEDNISGQEEATGETASPETEIMPGTDQDSGAQEKNAEDLAKENYDRYLRAVADFENYKKRTQKEQGELIKYANERILSDLLPIVDNFKRALSSAKAAKDLDKIVEGIEMIQKQILSTLEKFGVRPIESLNRPFDPFQHQAVGQVPIVEGSGLVENQVVTETQTGYFYNDRVLRPSLVIVAKQATQEPEAPGQARTQTTQPDLKPRSNEPEIEAP